MAFDRDRDGRIVKTELPERMHGVLAGDASGDEALDRAEIARLARTAPAAMATVRGFPGGGGGYAFGDQVTLSTRSHVEGALDDLRLDQYTSDRALTIVRKFMATLEANASAALMRDLQPLLTAAQLDGFKAALDRQLSGRPGVGVPFSATSDGKVRTFFVGGSIELLIRQAGLPTEQSARALAALERFKAQVRPGDAERSALLAQLTGVLSDEERENFGAALARRPLVKTGVGAGRVSGVVFGERVMQGDVISGPAVFTMPFRPAPRVAEP